MEVSEGYFEHQNNLQEGETFSAAICATFQYDMKFIHFGANSFCRCAARRMSRERTSLCAILLACMFLSQRETSTMSRERERASSDNACWAAMRCLTLHWALKMPSTQICFCDKDVSFVLNTIPSWPDPWCLSQPQAWTRMNLAHETASLWSWTAVMTTGTATTAYAASCASRW